MRITTLIAACTLLACSGQKQMDESQITTKSIVENRDVDCPPPLPSPMDGTEELKVDLLESFKDGYCLNIVIGYSGCGRVNPYIVQDPGSPTQITFWADNSGECDAYYQDTVKLNVPDKSRSVYYRNKEIRP